MVRFNYKIENYIKCEKCKHFIQHYNIKHNHIFKVNCGHCSKYDKNINPKTCKCPYFETVDNIKMPETVKNDIHTTLKSIELSLAYIKTYLYKDVDDYKIDNIISCKINKDTP